MNLLIVHSRSGADHKPYHIPAIHDIVLSSTLPPLIINGERVMYLTAEIRRSLYSPSTSLRIENDQTRPGGRPLILRSSTPTHSRTRIYPTKRTNERARFPLAKLSRAAAKLLANQMAAIIVHATRQHGQYERDLT